MEEDIKEIAEMTSSCFQYVSEEKVSDLLTCGICTCPYVKPLKTPCNHYFCFDCMSQYFQYNPNNNQTNKEISKTCPTCRRALTFASMVEESHPLILQQLNALEIYCKNKERGCEWKGPRSNLLDHIKISCKFVECQNRESGCKWTGKSTEKEIHSSKCDFQLIYCKHYWSLNCQFYALRKDILQHEKNCEKYLEDEERKRKKEEEERIKLKINREKEKLEQIQTKLKERKEEVISNRPIKINVSGKIFSTTLKTLCADPSSLLFSIYSNQLNKYQNYNIINNNIINNNNKKYEKEVEEEEIFIDCDAKSFSHILFWLRAGELPMRLKEEEIQSIRITSAYLNLTSLLSYLPSYFPSLHPPQTQKLIDHSIKISNHFNEKNDVNSPTRFSPSLSVPDQFFDLFDNDKENNDTKSDIPLHKKRKFEDFNNNNNNNDITNNMKSSQQRVKLTKDQLVSVSDSLKSTKNKGKLIDLHSRIFPKEKVIEIEITNAHFNNSLFVDSSLYKCNFSSSKFENSNFKNADLTLTNFTNCNLSNCNLSNANLQNTSLSFAKLTNSNLSKVNLSNSNLSSADLSNSNLTNANLSNADLTSANLSNCNLNNSNFLDANFTNTILPSNFSRVILSPSFDLGKLRKDWSHCDLSYNNFSGLNLTNINFSHCNLSNCNFKGANLSNSILSNANLSNSDLNTAILVDSNLEKANLTKCNISGANLSKANLTNANLTSSNISANFSSANLTSANLSNVSMEGTNFNSANISNAIFTGSTGKPWPTSRYSGGGNMHTNGLPYAPSDTKCIQYSCKKNATCIAIRSNDREGVATFEYYCDYCRSIREF